METLALEVEMKKEKFNLACIYKPPGINTNEFADNFLPYIEELSKKHKTYVCGDFNIDMLKYSSHTDTTNFVDGMFSLGLNPVINKPTRISTSSATLIDNIWSNQSVNVDKNISGIIIDDISDHLPVFHILQTSHQMKNSKNCESKCFRQESEKNISKMKRMLGEADWSNVLCETDVDNAYNTFLETYKCVYNTCCPLKKVKMKQNQYPIWMTKGLRNACKKKNLLYKKFLEKRTTTAQNKYKKYRNKLTSILRQTEKQFYHDQLNNHKDDIKNTWKIINTALNKQYKTHCIPNKFVHEGKEIIGNKNIANSINQYFVNIGPELAKNINKVKGLNHRHFMKPRINTTMYLEETSETDILNTIKNFKNKTSKDNEDISMAIIKPIITQVIVPLTHICNLSLMSGVFPHKMKTAKVIPIFKKGKIDEFSNYRPISILPQFSKVLEKIFFKKMISFLDKNEIIIPSQYGFRKNHSTVHAISELVESITDNIDEDKFTKGVFIDLKKAFDTVNH